MAMLRLKARMLAARRRECWPNAGHQKKAATRYGSSELPFPHKSQKTKKRKTNRKGGPNAPPRTSCSGLQTRTPTWRGTSAFSLAPDFFRHLAHAMRAVFVLLLCAVVCAQLPDGFVYLEDIDSTIVQEIRYYGQHNFMGRNVCGYLAPRCILTAQAAVALSKVQQMLLPLSYSLKVYDCYRPVMAVENFVHWALNLSDTLMEGEFYPTIPKSQLFALGYIAYNSSHSRGSTMDLTIIPNPAPQEEQYVPGMPLVPCFAPYGVRFNDTSIDMGTGFDCFSTLANTNNSGARAFFPQEAPLHL